MKEFLKPYLDAVLQGRDWSWTLVGLIYLIAGLIIRSWFLKPVVRRAKELDKKVYRQVKGEYLSRSVWGWLFFLITFMILVGLWNSSSGFPITEKQALLALAALASFILSIIFHLGAFAAAAIVTLKKVTGTAQRDLD